VTYTTSQVHIPTTTVNTSYRDRRIDDYSARELARKVFEKYDTNGSGRMGNDEAARMLTDLYASINVKYNASLDEGLEFMRANNTNGDTVLNTSDFETIFSNHLSTGTNTGYKLFNAQYGTVN
jgi:hypothetical protein